MKRLLIAVTLACVLSGTALAGEMPGVGGSVREEIPATGSTSTEQPAPPPVPGDMPGVGSARSSETESSLVAIVLFTFLTLIGR